MIGGIGLQVQRRLVRRADQELSRIKRRPGSPSGVRRRSGIGGQTTRTVPLSPVQNPISSAAARERVGTWLPPWAMATQSGGQKCRSSDIYSWQPKPKPQEGSAHVVQQARTAFGQYSTAASDAARSSSSTRHTRGPHKTFYYGTTMRRPGGLRARLRRHVRPAVLIGRICVHGQIDITTTHVRGPQSVLGACSC